MRIPRRINIHPNNFFFAIEIVEDDVLNDLVASLIELKKWQPIALLHWSIETPMFLKL